ncbi:hypothetical protein BDR07DRAFT_1376904 [Suillus spraguei]|nr:hypothetical protein BDR07DRAFT_1376904 [Suillus spraguei]
MGANVNAIHQGIYLRNQLLPVEARTDPVAKFVGSWTRTTQYVEVEAPIRSALKDAQQAAERILPFSGPMSTAVSVGQNAQADLDLDTADTFQDTCLKPLRMFDDVIGKIADVWTLLSVGTELI